MIRLTGVETWLWRAGAVGGWLVVAVLSAMLAVQGAKLAEARRGLEAGQRRAAALTAELEALGAALDSQTAAVGALTSQSQARMERASRAVANGRSRTQAAEAMSWRILAAPGAGADVCARVMAVDAAFLEALR
jgi:hypothetical protein